MQAIRGAIFFWFPKVVPKALSGKGQGETVGATGKINKVVKKNLATDPTPGLGRKGEVETIFKLFVCQPQRCKNKDGQEFGKDYGY
jgi:hypothetical protein